MKITMFFAFVGVCLSAVAALVLQRFSIYLLGCAIVTFACFGLDKLFALRGNRRIPEAFLQLLSLIGGAIPACAAMVLFHHKTRKVSFHLPIILMAVGHLALWWFYLR